MADDSGDSSDLEPRPSCSKNRRITRSSVNHGSGGNNNESRKGRQRRIVMRIEFNDSDDETSSGSDESSINGEVKACKLSNEQLPLCSTRARRVRGKNAANADTKRITINEDESDESDNIHKNTSRLRNRNLNSHFINGSDSEGSSSGSEINHSSKSRSTMSKKKIIVSEDEQMISQDETKTIETVKEKEANEAGFTSDSSSNELLEKCPICLLTFRQQEIGTPATCAHMFCANCIEAWSDNVQTCPIDRIEFDRIIVRENYESQRVVREINLDLNKKNNELPFNDESIEIDDEDVTNCEICNSPDREDVMLLCDECNQGYHMDCLNPPLTQIPEGAWYCDNCFDPSAESDDMSEELNLLHEDMRDMGIPHAALRVTEVQQPHILRTRQNERIRAAVLRTTRSQAAAAAAAARHIETTTTTLTTTTTTSSTGVRRGRGRPSNNTTTTKTTTTTRSSRKPRKTGRRRRRRARRRTYVVEYDLNNFDEKFAIKTTKKIIKRRRRKRRATKCKIYNAQTGERMTASKRLAEQMGVKKDPTYTSHLSGTSAGLSIFGGANDLEYFSDSDNGDVGGIEHDIHLETGHGTAVQTSIRISNFGSQRAHKSLLLGKLQGNSGRRNIIVPNYTSQNNATSNGGDVLSSIMDLQDRWHKAAKQMENVRISADGTLQLPTGRNNNTDNNNVEVQSNSHPTPTANTGNPKVTQNNHINPLEGVMNAPMFSRGGGNYNNRFNSNQNSYRNRGGGGGGGGGGPFRHSTGGNSGGSDGSGGGVGSGGVGGSGNFNFSNDNFNNNNNANSNPNSTPFSLRFNQRINQQRNNNNQRHSLPFMNRNNDDDRPQQQQNISVDGNIFGGPPPQSQQQNSSIDNPMFNDLPPPPAIIGPQIPGPPIMPTGPPLSLNMTGPPPMGVGPTSVPGPPSIPAPPIMPGPPPIIGPLALAGPPPPTLAGMSGPPPPIGMHTALQTIRPIMTVPPPPAPPPGVPMPWATTIFQQLNNDYGNDDDDSNCPNFSVYSAESQEVAKSSEMQSQSQQEHEAAKEDDENEDLVQLDDDDEIPMPPETKQNQSTIANGSDLYEPENPTEENDDSTDEDDHNDILKNCDRKIVEQVKPGTKIKFKFLKDRIFENEIEKKNEKENKDEERNDKKEESEQEDKSEQEDESGQEDESEHGNEKENEHNEESEHEKENEIENRKESENENENEIDNENENKSMASVEDEPGTPPLDKLVTTKIDDDNQYDPEHEVLSDDGSNMDADDLVEKRDDDNIKSNEQSVEGEHNINDNKIDDRSEHTPSPTASEAKLHDNDASTRSKKGVLELYDDSDWEELEIDKPKEYEKAIVGDKPENVEESELVTETEKTTEDQEINDKEKDGDEKSESEPDRSYTPCLDENNDPEEVTAVAATADDVEIIPITENISEKTIGTLKDTNTETVVIDEDEGRTPEVIVTEPDIIATEIISDDDDVATPVTKKPQANKKRDKSIKKKETFKKVSKKQKIRNYRTDKQQVDGKHKDRGKHAVKSKSRSRSISKSKSRSRTPIRSRSRIISRSRSRTPRGGAIIRSRSRSSSHSRSRTPRIRGRRRSLSRSRSRSLHSRSRSSSKENHWRSNNKLYDRKSSNQHRPKRREIQRYNVRNVVGMSRTFRESRERKDRYGRDTGRQFRLSRSPSLRDRRSFSRSLSRGRSLSPPRRNRRGSFSISPSPQSLRRRSISPRHRYRSPRRHSFSPRRYTPLHLHSRSPVRMRSRSLTPKRIGSSRTATRRARESPFVPITIISPSPPPRMRSMSPSPRYTPRMRRSRSKTPNMRGKKKNKKLKIKAKKKKKKQRMMSTHSPQNNIRLSRQRDAFEVARPPKKKRRHSPKKKQPIEETTWSPSPSPPPALEYERDNNISWTPPLLSPRLVHEMHGIYQPEQRRSASLASKREKRKRLKKKKKSEKRRAELRKEKRRAKRTQTPEALPSKEVFASGNNILVSVSFNKDAGPNQPSQTTVVTLPPSRDDLRAIEGGNAAGKKKKKRKKLDAKPVAIIDLERSPFQVHQEPADIIVLTDSEEGVRGRNMEREQEDDEHEHEHEHDHEHERRRRDSHRERRRSQSIAEEMEHHRSQMINGRRSSSQLDKTPPLERERLETIHEESYDIPQTGPKTPPEPPTVKFSMPKKQKQTRQNPLINEAELNSESEMAEVREPDVVHRSEHQHHEQIHVQNNQKIGPNTPPESGPCSPDAYDPFDPTKSPSLSPRSPSPPPNIMNTSQGSIGVESGAVGGVGVIEVTTTQKHIVVVDDQQRLTNERERVNTTANNNNSITVQGTTINPVELVMKLMNKKPTNLQDLSKTNDKQYNATHLHSTNVMISNKNVHDDKTDEQLGLTVLSNVLLANNGGGQTTQHIPIISSPTPMVVKSINQISKLPLPKVGSSVGSSSGGLGLSSTNTNLRNGLMDDILNLNDMDSPYSPGSADYEDLFEPPPDSIRRGTKRPNNNKMDVFDNLFGSTSPVGHMNMAKKYKAIITSSAKKGKIKVGKMDDHIKVYDDVPNSAVELQVKDRFLRKLNRQERVVEEVKLVLKPRYNKKQITKEDYKEIMRRAVPKICHSRSGEINPHKIKNLIDAYVRKFRAKHKKLSLLNTGQVSSAVKCAAYLKKL